MKIVQFFLMGMIKYIVFFVLFCTSYIYAQNFTYKHYSLEDGLPVRQVYDVVQDSTGLMWFATEHGIMTYDGTEWKLLNDEYPELNYRMIKIKADQKGGLYFVPYSTTNPIIYYYKNSIKKIDISINHKTPCRITCFDVLVNHEEPVIFYGTLISFGKIRDKYYILNNNKFNPIKNKIMELGFINDVTHYNNKFLLSTTTGLFSLSFRDFIEIKSISNELLNKNVLAFKVDEQLSNKKSISGYGFTEKVIFEHQHGLTQNICTIQIPEYFKSRTGYTIIKLNYEETFYYGEIGKLYRYDRSLKNHLDFELSENLSANGVTGLFEDKELNLWITTVRGINKVKRNFFKNHTKENGLFKNEVSSIHQFKNGKMFLGHNGGISIIDKDNTFQLPIMAEKNNYDRVIDVSKSKDDKIWFALERSSIGYVTPKLELNLINLGDEKVRSLLWDSENTLWIASNFNRIKRYDENLKLLEIYDYDVLNYTRKIFEFSDGNIYICASHGFYKIEKNSKLNMRIICIGKEINSYNAIEDNYGNIYICSKDGLYKTFNGVVEKVELDSFELNFPVYSVSISNDNTFWLGTEKGLLRWKVNEKTVDQYTVQDGLSGNETNRAANFIDSSNNLWIGTDRGVSHFKTYQLRSNKVKPKAKILFAENISGEKFSLRQPQELSYSSNNLFFHYRGFSYLDESKNMFRIELLDKNLNLLLYNETSEAKYLVNSISPGEYYFRVSVKSANGIWSDPVSSALIKINAPLYQEIWFISISLFFLGLIGFYINEYRVSKKYNKNLEIEVDKRTRLLSMSEKRYKKLLETSPVSILMTDSVNKILFCNEQTYEQFGYSKDFNLEGLDFSKFIHLNSIKEFNEILFGTIQYETIREQELKFVRKNKTIFPGMINSTVIFDENEDKINIIYTIKDTTIYKKVENRLKNINKDLETLVDQKTSEVKALLTESPFAIAIFSPDGSIEEINNVFRELFKSKNIDQVIEEYNIFQDKFLINSDYYEIIKNIFHEGGTFTSPIVPLEINNDERWIRARLYSIQNNNKVEKIVGMLEEVTQRKKMEEMSLKLIEQKRNAAAIIGAIDKERARISRDLHDGIGQLLTGIKIKLDSYEIEHSLQNDGLGEIGDLLSQAGNEIRSIIYDLHPVVIENYGLLFALKNICSRLHQNTDLEVKFEEQNYFGGLSKKSELPIFRIVQECLNNIVKHANCKNVTLRINEDLKEKIIKIEVIDDGIGFNLSEAENKAFGLTGLKQRAEFLNGEIKIDSEIGKGTQITLTVPI